MEYQFWYYLRVLFFWPKKVYAKIFEKKKFFFFTFGNSLNELFSFMTLLAIFDRNLVIFFEKTLKNQFSGRNKHFGDKPSDTNLKNFWFFTFISYFWHILSKITKIFFFFFLISKDIDMVTALEISYGLNLSFRSLESIGEYSEKNLAP